MMIVKKCYNCESEQHKFYAQENGFQLVKCDKCGLLFVNNRPNDDEITQAHMQGKHRGINDFSVTGSYNSKKIPQYLHILKDLFSDDLKAKTWLDIGCGHGEFITAVQTYSKNRIDVKGTDPNVHKQKSAQMRGLNVSYFDIDSHKERYDIISMLNVYSHLPNPPTFLKSLKKLLYPGSELILETGDTADFKAQDHYRPFYLPDHLSFASERIVVDILEKLGFEIVCIKKYPLCGLI
ncbi:MAG: class I SAM-dependent methyltransferase [Deltaproteobacteria bacterium]|nr:class I SAM-dependent methyltransferase [Deltaproteobacteria bacterium]